MTIIKPEDHGAVGDGVSDDTVAFRAACLAAMGGNITLELRGKYLLTTWAALDITARLRVRGVNDAEVIGPGGMHYLFNATSDFDIRGVTFRGWYGLLQRWSYKYGTGDPQFPWATTNIAGINEVRRDCVFAENTVENATGYVMNLGVKFDGLRIEQNTFRNCSGGFVLRIGEKVIGEILASYKGVKIRNNRASGITGPADHGAAFICSYLGGASEVSGNEVRNVTGNGTGEAWGIYLQAHDCTVANNRVYDVTTTGTADDITGISLKGGVDDRAGYVEQTGTSYICSGNIIRRIGQGKVWGTGIKAQARRAQVFSNEISNCSGIGVAMDNLLGSQDQSTRNNVIIACGTGVTLTGNGARYAITDNNIFECPIGINIAPGTFNGNANLAFVLMRGNEITTQLPGSVAVKFTPSTTVTALSMHFNILACAHAYEWTVQTGGLFVQTYIMNDHRVYCNAVHKGPVPSGVVVI